MIRSTITLLFGVSILNTSAVALTPEQLPALKEAVKEMCLFPDRAGDYLKAEGGAQVGGAVPIKVIKGNISGHVSYETWKGIPITLDKYKTDPRQCSLEMLKLLLPSFTAVSPSPIKSTPVPKSDQRDRSGRPASLQPRLPNVSGAYSRQDTEIVYKNWQYQSCTLHLVKHESLELRGSVPKAASMEGDLHVSYSASISYDGANTTDVLRAYDPSY